MSKNVAVITDPVNPGVVDRGIGHVTDQVALSAFKFAQHNILRFFNLRILNSCGKIEKIRAFLKFALLKRKFTQIILKNGHVKYKRLNYFLENNAYRKGWVFFWTRQTR